MRRTITPPRQPAIQLGRRREMPKCAEVEGTRVSLQSCALHRGTVAVTITILMVRWGFVVRSAGSPRSSTEGVGLSEVGCGAGPSPTTYAGWGQPEVLAPQLWTKFDRKKVRLDFVRKRIIMELPHPDHSQRRRWAAPAFRLFRFINKKASS